MQVICVLLFAVGFVAFHNQQREEDDNTVRWSGSPFNTTRSLFITMTPKDAAILEQVADLRIEVMSQSLFPFDLDLLIVRVEFHSFPLIRLDKV